MPTFQRHVFVCVNERPPDNPKGSCKARGGVEVRDALKQALAARGLKSEVRANNAGCLDQCAAGVTVVVYPEQVWYGGVTVADIPELVERHLVGGEVVERLMLPDQPHLGGARAFTPLRLPVKPGERAGAVIAAGPRGAAAALAVVALGLTARAAPARAGGPGAAAATPVAAADRAAVADDGAADAGDAPDPDDELVPDARARRQAAEANLEPERMREGLAIGVSVGPSWQIGFGIEEASALGGSLDLRLGTSASDRFGWFVDFVLTGTARQGDTSTTKLNQNATLAFGGQLFLNDVLSVRAGVGLAQLGLRSEEGQADLVQRTGVGVLSGGGLDLLRRGRFALSGDITFTASAYGDGAVGAVIFQLAATWY